MTNTQYTQLELESIFANDFQTTHFFSLASIYFESQDFNRALKVCEIGLKTHPSHLEARYMLAKIYLLNNQIIKSEKFLSKSVNDNLFSIKMLKLFIEIRDSLNRSNIETKKIVDQLLTIQPDDTFAHKWIHKFNSKTKDIQKIKSSNDIIFKIDENIVSYTLYNVLKTQKYYYQAQSVLNILESSKKISAKLYKKEKKLLSNFLN